MFNYQRNADMGNIAIKNIKFFQKFHE